jgi:formate--tetrahydrofolate ligase
MGGDGAVELANAVVEACEDKADFKLLYEDTTPLKERVDLIAKNVYGADGVSYTPEAEKKVKMVEDDPELSKLGTCMVKTHLSLSHDPALKGRPKGWTLPIRDIWIYRGAGFVVPVAGSIKFMPGTASDPALRYIDVDVNTGKVQGLF